MGVRGLTTFIAKNQENYFKKHKLRDCYVVIDAHSLCAQLYKFYTKSNDCFGGDYDKYKRTIETFFGLLKQCNVTPIVIFDGAYEKKKLKTVFQRLKSKVKAVKGANPAIHETIFPLFVREVLKDTILNLNILTARCDFEADFEIACIARQLNCPVISYDSDFYIFDVQYIPFPTMDFHVTKIKDGGTPYYIACKLYKIEHFLKQFGGLDKAQVPLMATLLGNDYIRKARFKSFYAHLKLSRKKIGERGDLQRQITAVIKWLREETYESAIRKVLGRMKKRPRYWAAKQIKDVAQGYICRESEILKFLKIVEETPTTSDLIPEINLDTIETDSENSDFCDESENDSQNSDTESEFEEKSETETFSDTEDKIISEMDEPVTKTYPEWFMQKYRKSEFPTMFMDLLSLRNCFYMPQVENVFNMQTLQISLPIIRAIAKILLEDEKYFTYYARNDFGRVKRYNVELSEMDLPNLVTIENMGVDERLKVLTNVLELGENTVKNLFRFPKRWHLFLFALTYWIQKSVLPTVNICHLAAILFCIINLEVVDQKLGYYRLKSQFLNKYSSKLNILLENKKNIPRETKVYSDIDLCIEKVDKNDSIMFANSFISNFALDEKLSSNFKAFNVNIVDAFAQFQNCLLYTKYLNSLLLYPLVDCNVADFLNGTFLYNVYANLASRSDLDQYLDLILKYCPSIYDLYKSCLNILISLVELKPTDSLVKKKRRRKRKKEGETVNFDSENEKVLEVEAQRENSDNEIDFNNKFSLLRLVE